VQHYSEATAVAYNRLWGGYAQAFARATLGYCSTEGLSAASTSILDLGCGTGQLVRLVCDEGFCAVGLDKSPNMLHWARQNCSSHIMTGRARFVEADMSDFSIEETFNLVTSSYDAINHLANEHDLRSCFRSIADHLAADGLLVFDLNTIQGLDDWNRIMITDREDRLVVSRGMFDMASLRAWRKFSGFVRTDDGSYLRFGELIYNSGFELTSVKLHLLEAGFRHVHFARLADLSESLLEPEREDRVVVIARY
jgi:SAM-dependent methyltransferase